MHGIRLNERVRRRSSLKDTAFAEIRYEVNECPLSLGRAIDLVQAFSSFPRQNYNNCRRQTILGPLFILGEADAYTGSGREKEPGAAGSRVFSV